MNARTGLWPVVTSWFGCGPQRFHGFGKPGEKWRDSGHGQDVLPQLCQQLVCFCFQVDADIKAGTRQHFDACLMICWWILMNVDLATCHFMFYLFLLDRLMVYVEHNFPVKEFYGRKAQRKSIFGAIQGFIVTSFVKSFCINSVWL